SNPVFWQARPSRNFYLVGVLPLPSSTCRRLDVQTCGRSVPACFRAILFLFKRLRTLLRAAKTQPFYFQSFPNSLPKTTRGGGYPLLSATPYPTMPCPLSGGFATLSRTARTPPNTPEHQ